MGKSHSKPEISERDRNISKRGMLILKVRVEHESICEKVSYQRAALEKYSKVQNSHFKTRIFQIYSCVISLKIQLYNSNPEKIGIKDIACKQEYDRLEGELEDLLKQAHKMTKVNGHHQIIKVDDSDQNNDGQCVKLALEKSIQQQSEDIDDQVYFSVNEKLSRYSFSKCSDR
ncbi:unnamed protein product [Moneuplotes crassus]|uniref:Uncharacterized protein n=1 Tax=Euplotes crassus TaxID=5936 RepID=A0AAD1XF43_EUPCR|nr:unnamed protein product [Moneuplotes crassus]